VAEIMVRDLVSDDKRRHLIMATELEQAAGEVDVPAGHRESRERFDPEYRHSKPLCGGAVLLQSCRHALDLFRGPAGCFDDKLGIDCAVKALANGVGVF